MNAFVESIDSWRDFYMLAGSASATMDSLHGKITRLIILLDSPG
jgi:hypothetical protein